MEHLKSARPVTDADRAEVTELWVGKYLRTVTYQRMNREGSLEMAPHCATVSLAEGMVSHARTAQIRTERWAPVGAGAGGAERRA
jgi:histidinol dehydrogenase